MEFIAKINQIRLPEMHLCFIGVTGTGTNACYMEKLDRVGTWNGDHNEPKQVC